MKKIHHNGVIFLGAIYAAFVSAAVFTTAVSCSLEWPEEVKIKGNPFEPCGVCFEGIAAVPVLFWGHLPEFKSLSHTIRNRAAGTRFWTHSLPRLDSQGTILLALARLSISTPRQDCSRQRWI